MSQTGISPKKENMLRKRNQIAITTFDRLLRDLNEFEETQEAFKQLIIRDFPDMLPPGLYDYIYKSFISGVVYGRNVERLKVSLRSSHTEEPTL